MSKYLVILHDAQDNSAAGREELKLRLCDALKVSEASVERLLSSLPVIIRRDLDKPVAEKYAETLEKLGAVVEAIEQVDGATSELMRETMAAPKSAASLSTASSEFNLSFDPPKAPKPEAKVVFDTAEHEAEINELESLLEQALESDVSQEDLFLTPPKESPEKLHQRAKEAPQPTEKNDDHGIGGLSFETSEPIETPRESLLFDMISAPSEEVATHVAAPAVSCPAATENAAPETGVKETARQESPPSVEPQTTSTPEAPPERQRTSVPFSPSTTPSIADMADSEPQARKKSRLRMDWLFFGTSIFALLFLAQPFIFRALGLQSQPGMNIFINIDSLLKEQSSILNGEKEKAAPTPKVTAEWVGELSEGRIRTKMKIAEVEKQLAIVEFEVETDKPAKLSPEELVQGKPLPVWLRRFETSNLVRQSEGSNADTALFKGNGRAYLEDGVGAERLVIAGQVALKPPVSDEEVVEARWSIQRGEDEKALPSENEVLRLNKKEFKLYFSGTVQLRRQAPSNPPPSSKGKPRKSEVPHSDAVK